MFKSFSKYFLNEKKKLCHGILKKIFFFKLRVEKFLIIKNQLKKENKA